MVKKSKNKNNLPVDVNDIVPKRAPRYIKKPPKPIAEHKAHAAMRLAERRAQMKPLHLLNKK